MSPDRQILLSLCVVVGGYVFYQFLGWLFDVEECVPRKLRIAASVDQVWGCLVAMVCGIIGAIDRSVVLGVIALFGLSWLFAARALLTNRRFAQPAVVILGILRLAVPVVGWLATAVVFSLLWSHARDRKRQSSQAEDVAAYPNDGDL